MIERRKDGDGEWLLLNDFSFVWILGVGHLTFQEGTRRNGLCKNIFLSLASVFFIL